MKKIFAELFELFVKTNKREPNAIETLQLKFKASQQIGKGEVIEFPREKITDWTKARPQPPEIEIIDGVQTTRGLGDLFERQMKNLSGELTSVPNKSGQSGLSYKTKNKEGWVKQKNEKQQKIKADTKHTQNRHKTDTKQTQNIHKKRQNRQQELAEQDKTKSSAESCAALS